MAKALNDSRQDGPVIIKVPKHEVLTVANQNVFPVFEERALNVATKYMTKLKDTTSWTTPAGVLLTVVLAFCTADFKDAFGATKDTWRAVMLIVGFFSLIWLIKSIVKAVSNRGLTPERFVEDLRGKLNISDNEENS